MRFRGQYYFVQIDGGTLGKQQIGVLKSFPEKKTFHSVRFLFCEHILQGSKPCFCFAMSDDIIHHSFAHVQVNSVLAIPVEGKTAFEILGSSSIRSIKNRIRFEIK